MTTSERIAAVMARVAAEVEGVTSSEGSREWETHRAPPCVLWKRTSAGPDEAGQLHDRAHPFQRAILGRSQSYAVKVWGTDWPEVDRLFEALVRALEHEAAGAWRYLGDVAMDVGQVTHGEVTIVTLSLRAHVPEAAPTTAEITTARVRRSATAAPDDGALEPGDP
jgi:hypothetical protein